MRGPARYGARLVDPHSEMKTKVPRPGPRRVCGLSFSSSRRRNVHPAAAKRGEPRRDSIRQRCPLVPAIEADHPIAGPPSVACAVGEAIYGAGITQTAVRSARLSSPPPATHFGHLIVRQIDVLLVDLIVGLPVRADGQFE